MNSTNETFNPTLSLFIPRVDTRCLPVCKEDETDQYYETRVKTFIAEKFYNIGSVDRVDLITKMTPQGYPFYIAFIHLAEWYNNFQAKGLQKAVFNPDQKAKMYLTPRTYWILCENKKPLTATEVDMKAIIYKQEQELEALKNEMKVKEQMEMEVRKKYEQDSPEAKLYASYMQEQLERVSCKLFESPVPSPVNEIDLEPPGPPPKLTRCITEHCTPERPTPSCMQWDLVMEQDEEEEEEVMPPPLTRCNV